MDGHRSLTFPVKKKNEIIYFYMFNSIIGHKSVTYKTEIHPPPLPSSKEIWSTIKYDYWLLLKVKPPPISDVICLLPYFSHWINVFKGKTSDVVMFEQITDPLRPFSFFFFFCLVLC